MPATLRRLVQPVDQRALVIGLAEDDLEPARRRPFARFRLDIGERRGAVDGRLALAEAVAGSGRSGCGLSEPSAANAGIRPPAASARFIGAFGHAQSRRHASAKKEVHEVRLFSWPASEFAPQRRPHTPRFSLLSPIRTCEPALGTDSQGRGMSSLDPFSASPLASEPSPRVVSTAAANPEFSGVAEPARRFVGRA